jgi:hypothetical protein
MRGFKLLNASFGYTSRCPRSLVIATALISVMSFYCANVTAGERTTIERATNEVYHKIETIRDTFWLQRGGNWFTIELNPGGRDAPRMVEVKGLDCGVSYVAAGDLPPLEKLNGLEWRGTAEINYAYSRTRDLERGSWTEWKERHRIDQGGYQMDWHIEKRKGKWFYTPGLRHWQEFYRKPSEAEVETLLTK